MVHYAAGILPVTWHEGQLLFLVGKDHRDGYSDFGGKAERVDRGCSTHTAAREFYEETLGTVTSSKAVLAHMTTPGNSAMLRSSTQNGYDYYMYIVEVPFVPHLRASFRKVWKFLHSLSLSRVYVEKCDVQYVTWDMLQKMPKRPVFAKTIAAHKAFFDALASSSPLDWRQTLILPH